MQYYRNLDIKEVTDKHFWKRVKLYHSKNNSNSERIMLLENNSIMRNKKEVPRAVNNFFKMLQKI